jgi:TolB-like protein
LQLRGGNDVVFVVQAGAAVEPQALPTDAEIRAQLDRIRSSAEFDAPERARRFLTYVVEETIIGRADRIKAYSIATEVFGRDSSFDAQTDPAVRIEAGRIRRALELYYLVAGREDPVIVTMPKGGYVPAFRYNHPEPRGEIQLPSQDKPIERTGWRALSTRLWLAVLALGLAIVLFSIGISRQSVDQENAVSRTTHPQVGPGLPILLVEPFEDLSGAPNSQIIARGLTDEVISQLSKFKEIVVTTGQKPAANAASARGNAGSLYALEGRVRVDDQKLRMSARLLNRTDGSVVWANNYDKVLKVTDLLELEADIARAVATTLAQPYGIIFQADAAHMARSPPDDWEAYACTLAYYGYRANLSPQTHTSVQSCLKRAVERYPNYATAWALLSLTYLDELRFRYRLDSRSSPSLDLATESARRASELDPQNVRALQAQMLAYFFRGDIDTALHVGARAFAINPNDTELSGEYGFRLALSGQWTTGCKLVTEAVSRNPGPLGYFEAALAVCAYISKDYATAERLARMADLRANPIYHVILLAILGKLGRTDDAAIERQWLESNAPMLLKNIRQEVSLRVFRPEDQHQFIEGLRKAGVAVPGE